jgi:hemerythrin-like domain-containing protein
MRELTMMRDGEVIVTRPNGNAVRGPQGGGYGHDPLADMKREHRLHMRMCDDLEAIADSLPDMTDAALCASLAATLRVELPAHHRGEEEGLFALIESRAGPEDGVGEMLEMLRREHAVDEGFAEELSELLEGLSVGRRPECADMAGYMLRGFFETYRRHVQWEEVVIVPLARRLLTPSDLERLSRRLF